MSDQSTDFGRIGQIAVDVKDVERATSFYRDVLGMRHLFSAPPKMSFFDCAGTRLLLGEPEPGAEGHGASVLYFDVPDIDGMHARLSERGVHFVQAPHFVADLGTRELWLAFFHDSEGNTLALMSERPKG
jgi:methylmalonyl-CoA/ethylmalonyl-CoA epimerase